MDAFWEKHKEAKEIQGLYLKFILFAFRDTKLLIKFLYSSFVKISFSIINMANVLNLSCDSQF